MHWELVSPPVPEKSGGEKRGRKGGKDGPGKRWGHSLTVMGGGKTAYIFGGFRGGNKQTNELMYLNTVTEKWTKPHVRGLDPTPRDSHTCTAIGGSLYVFGGTDGVAGLNDLYCYDTESKGWDRVRVKGDVPEPREGHAATCIDSRLYVFGGCGKAAGAAKQPGVVDDVHYDDVYMFEPGTSTWKKLEVGGAKPVARDSHACTAWGQTMVVFGGEDQASSFLNDVHLFDTTTLQWRQLATSGDLPAPRAGHVSVGIGQFLIVFGGFTDDRHLFHDIHVLDLVTGAWRREEATGNVPSDRFSLAGDVLEAGKGTVLFFGGCNAALEPLADMFVLQTGLGQEGGFEVSSPVPFGSSRRALEPPSKKQRGDQSNGNAGDWPQNLPFSQPFSSSLPTIGSHFPASSTAFPHSFPHNFPAGYASLPPGTASASNAAGAVSQVPMFLDPSMPPYYGVQGGVGGFMAARATGGGIPGAAIPGAVSALSGGQGGGGGEGPGEAGGAGGGLSTDEEGRVGGAEGAPNGERKAWEQALNPAGTVLNPGGLRAVEGDLSGRAFEGRITDVFPLGYRMETEMAGQRVPGMLFSFQPGFKEAAEAYTKRNESLPLAPSVGDASMGAGGDPDADAEADDDDIDDLDADADADMTEQDGEDGRGELPEQKQPSSVFPATTGTATAGGSGFVQPQQPKLEAVKEEAKSDPPQQQQQEGQRPIASLVTASALNASLNSFLSSSIREVIAAPAATHPHPVPLNHISALLQQPPLILPSPLVPSAPAFTPPRFIIPATPPPTPAGAPVPLLPFPFDNSFLSAKPSAVPVAEASGKLSAEPFVEPSPVSFPVPSPLPTVGPPSAAPSIVPSDYTLMEPTVKTEPPSVAPSIVPSDYPLMEATVKTETPYVPPSSDVNPSVLASPATVTSTGGTPTFQAAPSSVVTLPKQEPPAEALPAPLGVPAEITPPLLKTDLVDAPPLPEAAASQGDPQPETASVPASIAPPASEVPLLSTVPTAERSAVQGGAEPLPPA
eukprot:TRINITY_DN1848_c0_g1_i1.p1 TRINITY_DN1848_c0_g1~~TRINITY_DN1848_c0_g1_i1.p1  ORF type:complete len:1013 (+),score=206.92 TRINITY_DN1848_c0_g1_i1:674-3712(+)